MGFFSEIKEKLKKEWEKVQNAEGEDYEAQPDPYVLAELESLGLADNDKIDKIEDNSCNWEEQPKKAAKTAKLSKTYAAETPTKKAKSSKKIEREPIEREEREL